MGCAAASLTPPNVSAASLDSDAMRPVSVVALSVNPGSTKSLGSASNHGVACRLDKDCKVRLVELKHFTTSTAFLMVSFAFPSHQCYFNVLQ